MTNDPSENNIIAAPPVGKEQLKAFTERLLRYKSGKVRTEQRILASENWWKLRNEVEESSVSDIMASGGYKSASGWLHNVIVSKHADAMDSFPEPNILPREEGDKAEAELLSDIIPCVLEQNDFEKTYSDCMWQKLKTGTGVYKVTWDAEKLNGLGDIDISRVNLLNLYWEPGITDIQDSRYLFHTELVDRELLSEQYPGLIGSLGGQSFLSTRFLYDDSVTTEGKLTVIECYYHKFVGARKTLQYVKYVNDVVLCATENDPELSGRGLYDHGLYPYVFDPLFPIEGSPCGYGYVDICRSPQTTIDLLNTSFVKNAMAGATPRYFKRADGGVNEEEFLDLTKSIVNVNGNLGEDSLRQITFRPLDGIYVSFLDRTIQELRETSGNTETSTGNIASGVTAASAIAALQEASAKGSRDSSLSSYRAYAELIRLCIENIRQFYELPRQFRIVGHYGAERFVNYSNRGIRPQEQGSPFGVYLGCRLPVFDIRVIPQRKNAYKTLTQNELALQFFKLGFFDPRLKEQALMTVSLMEFEGKDEVLRRIAEKGTLYDKLDSYIQLSRCLAEKSAPELVPMIEGDLRELSDIMPMHGAQTEPKRVLQSGREHPTAERARIRAGSEL